MFLADRFVEGTCPYCKNKAKGDQCDSCGVVLDAKELIEPKCKICKQTPVFKKTKHLYLNLEKLESKLAEFYETNLKRDGFLTKNARQVVLRWLRHVNIRNAIATDKERKKEESRRAISRDLKWGVPIPESKTSGKEYEEKVFYVWFGSFGLYFSDYKASSRRLAEMVAKRRYRALSIYGKRQYPFSHYFITRYDAR